MANRSVAGSLLDEDVYPRIAGDLFRYPLCYQFRRIPQPDPNLDILERGERAFLAEVDYGLHERLPYTGDELEPVEPGCERLQFVEVGHVLRLVALHYGLADAR